MTPFLDDPFNVVKLAGKRIRTAPIEQIPAMVRDALDRMDPRELGIPVIAGATRRQIAVTMTHEQSVYGLIWKRGRLLDLLAIAYRMPGHE